MALLGIDIGGTSVKAALLAGPREKEAAAFARSAAYAQPDADGLTDAIAEVVVGVGGRRSDQIESEVPITHVGICVPGIVDPTTGVLTKSLNLSKLVGFPIIELIRRACPQLGWHGAGAPGVRLVTDARAAAADWLARHRPAAVGTGQPARRGLFLSLGTGIGGVVMDEATPLILHGASSGHFGQMDVTLDDVLPVPTSTDGSAGTLESYLGLPSLVRRYLGPGDAPASLREVSRGWDETAPPLRALVRAIRSCHVIYKPDDVVLLGGVGLLLAPHRGLLDRMVRDRLTSVAKPDWRLHFGDDDLHAARGAARLAAGSDPVAR